MQKYKILYLESMGLDENDFIPCEIDCDIVGGEIVGNKANDIHHIIGRGKTGEDRIENLMPLTRENHNEFGDKKYCMAMLLRIHRRHLTLRKIIFDNNWFRQRIREYEPYEKEHLTT